MTTAKEHYANALSDIYSWMSGGFENGIRRNLEFIKQHHLTPKGSALAVDLGAGCGFQSIPLAQSGYSVTAIDIDAKLLAELNQNSKDLPITAIQGDLVEFDKFINNPPELIVCMTDTIAHLDSLETVATLCQKAFAALEPEGKFIITFRDLTHELKELDRFIPIRSDGNTIFTCFLEYEPETVKVHDILYQKIAGNWQLHNSFWSSPQSSVNYPEHLRNHYLGSLSAILIHQRYLTFEGEVTSGHPFFGRLHCQGRHQPQA